MAHFAEKVTEFYQTIKFSGGLPEGIEMMHPHQVLKSKGFHQSFTINSIQMTSNWLHYEWPES